MSGSPKTVEDIAVVALGDRIIARIQTVSPLAADASRVETVMPVADQYQLQAEAFSHAVRNEQPDATALDDAVWNMRTIDALFVSVRSGHFERLSAG